MCNGNSNASSRIVSIELLWLMIMYAIAELGADATDAAVGSRLRDRLEVSVTDADVTEALGELVAKRRVTYVSRGRTAKRGRAATRERVYALSPVGSILLSPIRGKIWSYERFRDEFRARSGKTERA